MLATALNLLPGGQLDGGHILFSVNPEAHKKITWGAMVALVPLTLFFWSGWLIWILVLFFTRKHPTVPAWPDLDVTRRRLLIVAAVILLLTFMPTPIPGGGLLDAFKDFRL
jgi:membrane-associated protease RseP (regulator of RpoE activity)